MAKWGFYRSSKTQALFYLEQATFRDRQAGWCVMAEWGDTVGHFTTDWIASLMSPCTKAEQAIARQSYCLLKLEGKLEVRNG